MVTLHIAALDVDDPSEAQRVVDVFAAADAVDRPWHPGYPAAVVQVLATHGWDGDPELFFLGRDADGTLVAAGSAVLPTRDNLNAALVEVRVAPRPPREGGRLRVPRPPRAGRGSGRPHAVLQRWARVRRGTPVRRGPRVCGGLGGDDAAGGPR